MFKSSINLYKPLNYEKLEMWYYKILDLQEVQDLLEEFELTIRISNHSDAYGTCSNYGVIKINISWHINNNNSLDNLIDTIAHEIAHGQIWEHGESHNELTHILKNRIKSLLTGAKVNTDSRRNIGVVDVNAKNINIDDIYNKLLSVR